MTLVLRAHELVTNARQLQEDAVILSAQAGSVCQLIEWQTRLLGTVRQFLGRAYNYGRRDFKHLIRTLDAANEQLEQTMDMLRSTRVERVFRPSGEAEKCLMDFVDEKGVEAMRNALKGSIAELQVSNS
jgi:autophagy-related protein 17